MISPDTAPVATPSISIAMATFNGSRYLTRQLASLAQQDVLPIELVIRDDGSTDDTLVIVEKFAETAPFPVRVYRNAAREGYRANFMNCAAVCGGEILFFCDQDDVWEPNKLRRMSSCFQDPGVMAASHDAILIDDSDGVIGDMPEGGDGDRLENQPWPLRYGFSLAFRRSLLDHADLWPASKNHFLPDEQMGHDRWIVLIALALGKVVLLPDRLVRYRQHEANVFGIPGRKRHPVVRDGCHKERELGLMLRAAESCVHVLAVLKHRIATGHAGNIGAMSRRYKALVRRFELRLRLHQSARPAERAWLLTSLILGGNYRSGDGWKFPLRALKEDLRLTIPVRRQPVCLPS